MGITIIGTNPNDFGHLALSTRFHGISKIGGKVGKVLTHRSALGPVFRLDVDHQERRLFGKQWQKTVVVLLMLLLMMWFLRQWILVALVHFRVIIRSSGIQGRRRIPPEFAIRVPSFSLVRRVVVNHCRHRNRSRSSSSRSRKKKREVKEIQEMSIVYSKGGKGMRTLLL